MGLWFWGSYVVLWFFKDTFIKLISNLSSSNLDFTSILELWNWLKKGFEVLEISQLHSSFIQSFIIIRTVSNELCKRSTGNELQGKCYDSWVVKLNWIGVSFWDIDHLLGTIGYISIFGIMLCNLKFNTCFLCRHLNPQLIWAKRLIFVNTQIMKTCKMVTSSHQRGTFAQVRLLSAVEVCCHLHAKLLLKIVTMQNTKQKKRLTIRSINFHE